MSMFNNFLIAIGLRAPRRIDMEKADLDEKEPSSAPLSDQRFNDDLLNDVLVHPVSEEVEIKALRTFNEVESLGEVIRESRIVALDLRDINETSERRRIIDFVMGMVYMAKSSLRIIHTDGVYLIKPKEAVLSVGERERLQELGLYRV